MVESRGVVGVGVWLEKGCGGRRGVVGEGVWWEKGCGGRRGMIRREGVDIESFMKVCVETHKDQLLQLHW